MVVGPASSDRAKIRCRVHGDDRDGGVVQDEVELAEALAGVLAAVLGPVEVEGLVRLTGGASRETWAFDAVDAEGARSPLVLRRDPPGRPGPPGSMALEAAARAGEQLWELPLFRPYAKGLESDVADIKNVTGLRYGGAITAALFLERYAGEGPWAHIDMAATALTAEATGEHMKGGTGYGVRTLVEIGRAGAKLPEGAAGT